MYDGVEWGELYDLENDQGEFENLWNDPNSADERTRLIEALARAEISHIDHVPFPVSHA